VRVLIRTVFPLPPCLSPCLHKGYKPRHQTRCYCFGSCYVHWDILSLSLERGCLLRQAYSKIGGLARRETSDCPTIAQRLPYVGAFS
jgi:hypothetical protein